MTKVAVVLPAYNEASGIGPVLEQIGQQAGDLIEEVIVVDDASTDRTAQIAAQSGASVIVHNRNRGYGAALKTGIRAARSELVLTMDADGQHRPEDIRKLVEGLSNNDMVVGHRQGLLHSTLWRMPGKWLLRVMANYLAGQVIPDLNCGMRLLRKSVAANYLHLCPSNFSFSTTMTMAMLNRGYSVVFVPIEVNRRTGKSTVSVATGFKTIVLILRVASLFSPLRIFLPLSALVVAAGVGWAVPYVIQGRGVSVGATLAMFTGLLLFSLGLISDQISQLRLERYE